MSFNCLTWQYDNCIIVIVILYILVSILISFNFIVSLSTSNAGHQQLLIMNMNLDNDLQWSAYHCSAPLLGGALGAVTSQWAPTVVALVDSYSSLSLHLISLTNWPSFVLSFKANKYSKSIIDCEMSINIISSLKYLWTKSSCLEF